MLTTTNLCPHITHPIDTDDPFTPIRLVKSLTIDQITHLSHCAPNPYTRAAFSKEATVRRQEARP